MRTGTIRPQPSPCPVPPCSPSPPVAAAATSDDAAADAAASDSGEKQVNVYGTDGNMGNALGEDFTEDRRAGRDEGHHAPHRAGPDFTRPAARGRPRPRQDYNYAGETYDAVIITALAAQAGRHQRGHRLRALRQRRHLRWRDVRRTSPACLEIIDAGGNVDYDGITGPLSFTDAGEPAAGQLRHRCSSATDNTLDAALTEYVHRRRRGERRHRRGPGPGRARRHRRRPADHRHAAAADRQPGLPRPAGGRRRPAGDQRHQRRRWRARRSRSSSSRVTPVTPRPTPPPRPWTACCRPASTRSSVRRPRA